MDWAEALTVTTEKRKMPRNIIVWWIGLGNYSNTGDREYKYKDLKINKYCSVTKQRWPTICLITVFIKGHIAEWTTQTKIIILHIQKRFNF